MDRLIELNEMIAETNKVIEEEAETINRLVNIKSLNVTLLSYLLEEKQQLEKEQNK